MKNKTIILILTLVFVSMFAFNAAAKSEWEAISGFNITDVTLDTYNDTIDSFNNTVEGTPGVTVGEKFENIDRVPLIYLGAKRSINEKWDLNIRYEYIFGEVKQSYTLADSYDNSIKVDLHGLTFLADYNFNKNWYASGGVGYHQGTKTTDLNGAVYDGISNVKPSVETGENDYDLDSGISLRAGVGYDRDFAKNWTFNGKIDYLYLEIDDEQQGDIDSEGFSYTAGLTYRF